MNDLVRPSSEWKAKAHQKVISTASTPRKSSPVSKAPKAKPAKAVKAKKC